MSQESNHHEVLAWNFYQNPRWSYDEFFPVYILKPLKFRFVQKYYNRALAEFAREAPELMHRFTTIQKPGGSAWFAETLGQIEKAGVSDLYGFLERVTTRSQAQAFLDISGIAQPDLMGWVDYVKQWWLPYPATLRQLVEEGDPLLDALLGQLKGVKIANSMTLLEAAAEPGDRTALAQQLGIAVDLLSDLVHRADVSRLPYTSGGAVKRLWAMGYRSLSAIRAADLQEYAARVEVYFAAGGQGSTFDSKMTHILSFLKDARHTPEVVKAA
jgi:hypothetical protein